MILKQTASSGQKVLASIVIRLALAEFFGSNCGVFALDEPTTHLDEENTEALAMFLKRLAETKKAEKNFQMIIITHDENFLKFLGAKVGKYYEVKKDSKGCSRIVLKEFN
jgi:DNA repair protein RAD50